MQFAAGSLKEETHLSSLLLFLDQKEHLDMLSICPNHHTLELETIW